MFSDNKFKDHDHPNPIMYREDYILLNGEWDFLFDYKNKGEKEGLSRGFTSEYKINVPYVYNTPKSNINITKKCDNVWYSKVLHFDELKDRYILHFEGSDYITKVFINSELLSIEKGGYHRISYDITDYLTIGDNTLVVKCEDSFRLTQPRGKQRFLKKNYLCWYEEVTGIYKTVWIEKRKESSIESLHIKPSLKEKLIDFHIVTTSEIGTLEIELSYKDKIIKKDIINMSGLFINHEMKIDSDIIPWEVLNPTLYDLKLTLKDDKGVEDILYTYTAFRDIKVDGSRILLNGNPLYQKLVLDQGYFNDSLLTGSYNELEDDILNMIKCGFNGARKHQKIEDERYYYLADKYGFIVWAEMPSMYKFNSLSRDNFFSEYAKVLKQLINHPSIITWVIFNESWGIFRIHHSNNQIAYVNMLYKYTKGIDDTRLVISNDGWDHTISDILTIHLYDQDQVKFKDNIDKAIKTGIIKSFTKKHTFAKGYHYNNEPIMISEFGGTSFVNTIKGAWGYGKSVKDVSEYRDRLDNLFAVIQNDDRIIGYCYTQVSDFMQETNGIYTMDRKAKIDPSELNAIQKRRDNAGIREIK